MGKILNLGDFFMFSLEDLKKINQNKQDNDRIDHKNIEQAICFFDENNISFLRTDIVLKNERVIFEQKFLDLDHNIIFDEALFDQYFLLHLNSIISMEESQYSLKPFSLSEPFKINEMNFYDGDLYAIPISAIEDHKNHELGEKFSHAILRSKERNLTHLIISINYECDFRSNAEDDLTSLYTKKYKTSYLNPNENPIIHSFLTNNLGNKHYRFSEMDDDYYDDLTSNEIVENSFYSEKNNTNYNNLLGFIDNLSKNALKSLLNSQKIIDHIEFIGNFQTNDKNFISTYQARQVFKEHQIRKMTHLDDIKAVFISKQDLPEKIRNTLSLNSSHLVYLPINNKHAPNFTQIIKLEAYFKNGIRHYDHQKNEVDIFEFNDVINNSKNIEIIMKDNEQNKKQETFFPYRNNKISDDLSELAFNIKIGTSYLISLAALKKSIKTSDALTHLNYLEHLNVDNCIVSINIPYYFLESDRSFENNDKIYIERARHPELRIYPLKNGTYEFLDLKNLDFDIKEKQPIESVYEKLNPATNIILNTGDCIHVLKEQNHTMNEIESSVNNERNIHFQISYILNNFILKSYFRKLENKSLEEKNKTTKKLKI